MNHWIKAMFHKSIWIIAYYFLVQKYWVTNLYTIRKNIFKRIAKKYLNCNHLRKSKKNKVNIIYRWNLKNTTKKIIFKTQTQDTILTTSNKIKKQVYQPKT